MLHVKKETNTLEYSVCCRCEVHDDGNQSRPFEYRCQQKSVLGVARSALASTRFPGRFLFLPKEQRAFGKAVVITRLALRYSSKLLLYRSFALTLSIVSEEYEHGVQRV